MNRRKDNANEKKEKKSAYDLKDDAPTSNTFHEPGSIYHTPQSEASLRAITMMGLEHKRDFAVITNDNDFIKMIRAGIPKEAMTHLMQVADLTLDEMAAIIHTSDRTLRRYTSQQKLSQDQSERMIEMAKLYSKGEKVFGTLESFKEWMDTALLPFGNKKPKSFLDTSLGIAMIVNELGRIEHGIFA